LSDLNSDAFALCPRCGAAVRGDVFPAFFRPPASVNAGELVMAEGESACFYHDNKKATVVCEGCGRFLCGLCDCFVHGRHFCPGCLEAGQQRKSIVALDTMRPLYAYQALLCAVIPLFITGCAAVYLALRHRHAPGSLVSRHARWQMPVALTLGTLQVLGGGLLIYWLATQ
jgi:hypothetical protein